MGTDLEVYKSIGNPLVVGTEPKIQQAIAGFTRCPVDQVPAVLMTCMLEGISLKDYARTYHNMMGQSVMKASAMIANFRTKFGGTHEVIETTPLVAHLRLKDKAGNPFEITVTAEDAYASRWPWNDWKVAHGEMKKHAGKTWDERFAAMQPFMKDNWGTPRDWETMLWWRAVSTAIDRFAPEVDSGTASVSDLDSLDVVSTKITTNKPKKPSAKDVMAAKALNPPAEPEAAPPEAAPPEAAPPEAAPPEAAPLMDANTEDVQDAEFVAAEESPPETAFASATQKKRLNDYRARLASVMSDDQWNAALAKRGAKTVHTLSAAAAEELANKLADKVREVEAQADNF